MPTLSDIQNTPLSNLNHIDALLDSGPDWNFLTPVGNVMYYTFSITSGNEVRDGAAITGQQAFTISQKAATRTAMQYISELTGIVFTETAVGENAQVHFANIDIDTANTTGLLSWNAEYQYYSSTGILADYSADAYVYLDNNEFGWVNADLTPGTAGFETLLHELGHMLGLKHPFEPDVYLPADQDNTSYTLMSYTSNDGPYSQFSRYDIAALNWLYGGDGLGGDLGINSVTGARFITGTLAGDQLTGTAFNDTLKGDLGNDMIAGGEGTDTAIFAGNRSSYTITELGDGSVVLSGTDGTDTATSIEKFQFSDGTFARAQLVAGTALPTPTMSVAKNAYDYVKGKQPVIEGVTQANGTVNVYSGNKLVATAKADATGFWKATASPFADGLDYAVYARAADGLGNLSAASAEVKFHVDTYTPWAPTANVSLTPGSNQPVFSGYADAGTVLQLTSNGSLIGSTTVNSGGYWTIATNPLANAAYNVTATSLDKAGNASSTTSTLTFTVASTLNQGGTAANDTLTATAGNNNIDGGAGNDTVVFSGSRASYDIIRDGGGYVVSAKGGAADGKDMLLNVETLQFADSSVSVAYDDVVQALYVAYFGRAADSGGLANFQAQLAGLNAPRDFAGVSDAYATNAGIRSLIDSFGNSAESNALYSGSTTDFVTAVYRNVLNRDPDAGGLAFWVDAIDRAGLAKTNASLSIMAGALANTTPQGKVDGALVSNKTTIASNFTFAIDTSAELEGYKGDAAAATVRSMLASATPITDVAAFQATIKSVLDALDGPGTMNGSMADLGYAVSVPEEIDAGIMLVGVPQTDEVSLLA